MSSPSPPAKKSLLAKILSAGGGAIALYANAKVQSPMGEGNVYLVVSLISGLLGFTAMVALKRKPTQEVVIVRWAALAIAVGILCIIGYQALLYSQYETSPSWFIEFVEGILFGGWSFCVFAVFGAAYTIGGLKLIQDFLGIRKAVD